MTHLYNEHERTERQIPVLNEGFVRLVDSMGNDARILDAARVSYANEGPKGEVKDKALIDYLMRHRHTSPFEKVRFEFHVRVPLFIARQWMRHRTGSFNEVSARYTEMSDAFWRPNVWRKQNSHNKQVTNGELEPEVSVVSTDKYLAGLQHAYDTYDSLLDDGVGREQARAAMPLASYTEFYWTIDAHNLLHFLKLRLHEHAQEEIRDYAEALLELIQPIIPLTVASWENHQLYAQTFSQDELGLLLGELNYVQMDTLIEAAHHRFPRTRAREFLEKLGLYG